MNLGVIQARMSSSRLPGKVLRPILGIPMLLFMIGRVKLSRKIDKIYVATSTDKTDEPIRELCHMYRIPVYCGPLDDVLTRFYWLSQIDYPEHIVRLTGDCPLIDPNVIDATIHHHVSGNYDYTRNYGFPDGLDTECMTVSALETVWKNAIDPYDKEHVTPYLYKHPEMFKLGRYENKSNQESVKISVDTEEDFQKVIRLVLIQVNQDSTVHITNGRV